jgi:hypothetical protein
MAAPRPPRGHDMQRVAAMIAAARAECRNSIGKARSLASLPAPTDEVGSAARCAQQRGALAPAMRSILELVALVSQPPAAAAPRPPPGPPPGGEAVVQGGDDDGDGAGGGSSRPTKRRRARLTLRSATAGVRLLAHFAQQRAALFPRHPSLPSAGTEECDKSTGLQQLEGVLQRLDWYQRRMVVSATADGAAKPGSAGGAAARGGELPLVLTAPSALTTAGGAEKGLIAACVPCLHFACAGGAFTWTVSVRC